MNQKFKTLILWALPILLVIALSYQFLSSSNVDSLKSNGTTVAPRNSAVARVSYGRFLDYINSEELHLLIFLREAEMQL